MLVNSFLFRMTFMNTNDLTNQIAIISGGLGDIGRAIAIELAKRGADIAIGDLHLPEEAEPFISELQKIGAKACYHQIDVSEDASVVAWLAAVETKLGTPTIIIPNAAIVTQASICDMDSTQWQREIDINLNGAFHLAKSGANHLKKT